LRVVKLTTVRSGDALGVARTIGIHIKSVEISFPTRICVMPLRVMGWR
jgi:hypothetical protein